jgi:hypothetical protein
MNHRVAAEAATSVKGGIEQGETYFYDSGVRPGPLCLRKSREH